MRIYAGGSSHTRTAKLVLVATTLNPRVQRRIAVIVLFSDLGRAFILECSSDCGAEDHVREIVCIGPPPPAVGTCDGDEYVRASRCPAVGERGPCVGVAGRTETSLGSVGGCGPRSVIGRGGRLWHVNLLGMIEDTSCGYAGVLALQLLWKTQPSILARAERLWYKSMAMFNRGATVEGRRCRGERWGQNVGKQYIFCVTYVVG